MLTYLREIVYGGVDGIVTTFAVVAGFAGANVENSAIPLFSVLLFGFANLFADATSMGLGNFLSMQSEKDAYHSEKEKERREIQSSTEFERAETIEILESKGYSTKDAQAMTHLYAKNEDYWAEFMMREELKLPVPESNAAFTAFVTFVSFICFGFIPLIPYVISKANNNTFSYSIFATFIALLLLAYLRWQVTKFSFKRAILETLATGGFSALVAYLVGTFFRV
jgi:VIT1/CCC1 family predicted Fe2+/Mn2+ transporter